MYSKCQMAIGRGGGVSPVPFVSGGFSASWWALFPSCSMLCDVALCGPVGPLSDEAWGLSVRRFERRGGPEYPGKCSSRECCGLWGCNNASWCAAPGAEAGEHLCSFRSCQGV